MREGKTIDRIRKLLALAKGTTSESESESAQRMADALMAACGLTAADVESGADAASTVAREFVASSDAHWQGYIALGIAEMLGIACWRARGPHGFFRVWAGTDGQREAAKALLEWIVGQVDDLAKAYVKRQRPEPGASARRIGHDYRTGMAAVVQQRLRALAAERPAPTSESALVKIGEVHAAIAATLPANMLEAFRKKGMMGTRARPRLHDARHAHAGAADSAAVRIQRGVGPADRSRMLKSGE